MRKRLKKDVDERLWSLRRRGMFNDGFTGDVIIIQRPQW